MVASVSVELLRVVPVGWGQVGILASMCGSLQLPGTLRCRRKDTALGYLGAISRLPSKPSARVRNAVSKWVRTLALVR